MAVSYGIAAARATGSGHWVLKDDVIRLISFSSAARSIALAGSVINPLSGKELEALSGNQTTNADRTSATTDYTVVNDGFLAACTVALQSGEAGGKRGECFVRVVQRRGGVVIAQILADYIEANYNPPMGVHKSSVEGKGLIRSIDLGNPAAGADYANATVPTNGKWVDRGFAGTLVANGNAANRVFNVDVTDGVDIVDTFGSPYLQTASQTIPYRGHRGFSNQNVTTVPTASAVWFGIPDTPLPEAYVLDFRTANLLAGDDWGDGQLLVEEWIDP